MPTLHIIDLVVIPRGWQMHNYTVGGNLVVCLTASNKAVVMDGELYYTCDDVPIGASVACYQFSKHTRTWNIMLKYSGAFELVDSRDKSYAKSDVIHELKGKYDVMYICQYNDDTSTTTLTVINNRLWAKLRIHW